jgi:Flp pilus assembly protein TadB
MPFFDRFWWLRLLGAVGLPILVAAIATDTALNYPWDQLVNSDFGSEEQWVLCAYGIFMILMLAQAVSLARSAQPARDRYRGRLAALAGDQDAIPRATTIAVDASRAPDLRTGQLELLRRTTRAGRRANVALFVFVCLLFGSFIVLGIIVVVLVLGTPSAKLFPADPLSLAESIGLLLLLVAFCFVMPIALIVWFGYDLAGDMRGRPRGVVADDTGLTYYPQAGRSRRVHWGEMQLIEVSLSSSLSTPYCEYKLFARVTTVEWTDYNRSNWETTTGLTRPVFEERHQALLDLIAARTGLLPRTFEKKLQRGVSATSSESGRFVPLRNAGCLTILLLAALGFGIALILAPLSTSATLNLLVGGAFGAGIAYGGIDTVLGSLARRRRRREAPGDLDLATLDDGTVYVLIRRRSLPARIASLLTGLLLAVDLLPVVVLWFPAVGQALMTDAELRITDGFGMIAAYILLACGLFGVLGVIGALRSAATQFRADATALSQAMRGRERGRIRWEAIADMRVWKLADGSRFYWASDSGRHTTIVWNDGPPDATRVTNVGDVLVSGEQLAAIVARRSGVPLAVEADLADPSDWPFSRPFSNARRS